jgi:hypothetical protein
MTALVACAGSGTTPSPATDKVVQGSGGGGAAGLRPAFHGTRELGLRRGHQVTLLRDCVAHPHKHHVCEAIGNLTYAAYGRSETATLTDAVMAPSRDHTAWLVRMSFAKASGRVLRASVAQAADTDEFLLVLDSRQRVLVPLDPPWVSGTTVTVGPVTKIEAWHLVQLLAKTADPLSAAPNQP